MTVSDHTWDVIGRKKAPLRHSYLSLLDWKETWLSSRSPFTPLTNDVYALTAALDEILEEGIDNVLRRHEEAGRLCRDGVKDLGLQLWPLKEEYCSPTVTAIKVPAGMSDAQIIDALVQKHRILISGGLGLKEAW